MSGEVSLLGSGSECTSGSVVWPGLHFFHDADVRPPVYSGSTDGSLGFQTGATDASYLSFVLEVSSDLISQIRVGMLLLLDLDLSVEPAFPAYVRAHFKNEGGSEELHDLIVLKDGRRVVQFNLDGLRIPLDRRMEVWVHVILAEPVYVALTMRSFDVSIVEQ